MNRGDVEAFLSRDWARVARAKEAHWDEVLGRGGALVALRVADELRRHARAVHPDWPSSDERKEDLEVHLATSAILRRAPRIATR